MPFFLLILSLLVFGLLAFFVGREAAADPYRRHRYWLLACTPIGLTLLLMAVIVAAWLLWQWYTAAVPFLT